MSYSVRGDDDEETNILTVDQEMDLALKSLADSRAKIYKQISEVDTLQRKAGELSRNVLLQCSIEYEEEPDAIPFFMEAFQQQLADIDAAGKDPHTLIHCFPATQTGIRPNSTPGSRLDANTEGSNKKKSIVPMRPNPVQIQITPIDLFS
jgi:hypothetical protein